MCDTISLSNSSDHEHGNILFIILIAVALIAFLTGAIMNTGNGDSANIDKETLSIRVSEVQRYSSELERAIRYILDNGVSESDIRFSHANAPSAYGDLSADTDKTDQVFAREGGGAIYRDPPSNVNDGSNWEFYGGTHAPSAGSDRADLIAVLPNVTEQFCVQLNAINGQPESIPEDTGAAVSTALSAGDCVFMENPGRFSDSVQFYTTPNTMVETDFTQDTNTLAARPALQACVECERDSSYHFYHVLIAR